MDDWEIPKPEAGLVIQSTLHDYTGGTEDRFEPKPGFDEEIIRQTAGSAREGFAWAFRQAAILVLSALPLMAALRRTPAQARAEAMAASGQGPPPPEKDSIEGTAPTGTARPGPRRPPARSLPERKLNTKRPHTSSTC